MNEFQVLAQGVAELAMVVGFHSEHMDKVHGLLTDEQREVLSRAINGVADGVVAVNPAAPVVETVVDPVVTLAPDPVLVAAVTQELIDRGVVPAVV